ncbi:hypothetical protein B7760_03932 [Burkholderia glumae]|nr:hypothetical protein B7760_03932 [Burkholderia glumae]
MCKCDHGDGYHRPKNNQRGPSNTELLGIRSEMMPANGRVSNVVTHVAVSVSAKADGFAIPFSKSQVA